MDTPRNDSSTEENTPKFRGLYRHVKISVKALDWIIGICIAVILLVVVLELADPGYTVTFDSKGGTDVVSQECNYGDLVKPPQPPSREGYAFVGWYKDSNCYERWDLETETVQTDMTLYAGWEKTE